MCACRRGMTEGFLDISAQCPEFGVRGTWGFLWASRGQLLVINLTLTYYYVRGAIIRVSCIRLSFIHTPCMILDSASPRQRNTVLNTAQKNPCLQLHTVPFSAYYILTRSSRLLSSDCSRLRPARTFIPQFIDRIAPSFSPSWTTAFSTIIAAPRV